MSRVREIRAALEAGTLAPAAALPALRALAHSGATRAARIDAYQVLGDVAGRAFDAPWEVAEGAAWELLGIARRADSGMERRDLVLAMGRGFRNLWLLPFVHSRLRDDDATVVEAAIHAAGGLGFAGLEEDVSAFLDPHAPARLRLAAVQALGRMGATSQAARVASLIELDPALSAAALSALMEMRSPAGVDAALALVEVVHDRDLLVAAVTYLAEMGREEVLPVLRRLSRDEDARLRLSAGLASRGFKAERTRDPAERLLVALVDRDRAVRAVLARRLRTLPVLDVLAEAGALFGDDPEGVIQVVGEVTDVEATRFLVTIAEDAAVPELARARAAGAIRAMEPRERDDLERLAGSATKESVRVAALQTLGAFSSLGELFDRVEEAARDPSPAVRAAFLWALQLAAPPAAFPFEQRKRVESVLEAALGDEDETVRRRAAYVAGNLGLSAVAPHLVALARKERDRVDLRVAAFVGLGELTLATSFVDLVALFKREEAPEALAAAGRALARTIAENPGSGFDLGLLAPTVAQLLGHAEPMVREAAVRLAGSTGGAVPPSAVAPLLSDLSPRVRAEAAGALGRLRALEAEPLLVDALEAADPELAERAAEALLGLGSPSGIERALSWIAGDHDADARADVAARIDVAAVDAAHLQPLVSTALKRLSPEDPAYEALLMVHLQLLDTPVSRRREDRPSVEESIAKIFPTYAELVKVRGFEPLGRSLRTAEALYHTATGLDADADHSPPIVLWMKTMEGYVHAWLGGRLGSLQRQPGALFEQVDRVVGPAWPGYQKFVRERWEDEVEVGGLRVEVPLRSLSNALRDYQERRTKRLDSPLSVTEWARLMVFLAVDHPAGVKNLLQVRSTSADRTIRLCHRLHVLAAVRNVVTHRSAAAERTLDAFRTLYYGAFEEMTKMA